MMQHFVVAAEIRVLVLESVIAVRAGRDDLFNFQLFEKLDVRLYERLAHGLLAQPAGGLAAAGLAFAQDGEGDALLLEERGEAAAHFLRAVVESSVAAEVKEVFRVGLVLQE